MLKNSNFATKQKKYLKIAFLGQFFGGTQRFERDEAGAW